MRSHSMILLGQTLIRHLAMSIIKPGRTIKLAGHTYRVERQIGQGGSGEVHLVTERNLEFALKVFFPYYQLNLFGPTELSGKIGESLEFQRREHQFLSSLLHPNIVRVHQAGELVLQKNEVNRVQVKRITSLPVLVTDFIDGYPLNEAIDSLQLQGSDLAHILRRIAYALKYLHDERQYMHMDIKAGNIVVRKVDLEPILIDFALCKNLNFTEVDSQEYTRIVGDWDLFPKDLSTDHRLKTIKETHGSRAEIRSLAFPYIDLFQVGRLLEKLVPRCAKVLDEREVEYLREIGSQLVDWSKVTRWRTADLVARFSRIGPEHFTEFSVPELTSPMATERTIVLPPGIGVPVTKLVKEVIETRSFRRLTQIQQLALLSFVYPAADYKRSVHVLFSYDLGRQLVTQLYTSPLFRSLFDIRSTQQLLITVLLHDINHFPFLHIFQESGIRSWDRLTVLDFFCDGEATGERAAKTPSIYDILADLGIDRDRFKRLLLREHHEQTSEVDQVISSCINSGVDLDKLSYLFLDSYFTGVRYGAGIDLPCLLKAATLGRLASSGAPHLAFTDRALQALESVVMSRFWNFRSLYWHHTNRAVMAMVLHVVRSLYQDAKSDPLEYLADTRWRSEGQALQYLDQKYQSHYGRPSIVSALIEDRARLYRRLYTVRAGMGDGADDALYKDLRRLSIGDERRLCAQVTTKLFEFLGAGVGEPEEDEVLLDIPRREMDSGGAVYMVDSMSRTLRLSDVSAPARSIDTNYEQLAKRIRFFISPRVAQFIEKRSRHEKRSVIQAFLREAVKAVKKERSEVK